MGREGGIHLCGRQIAHERIERSSSLIGCDGLGMAEHLKGAAEGAVAGGVRAAEEGDAGFAEGGGEMEGAAIDADDGGGAAGGVDESGEGGDVDVGQAGDVSGLVGRNVEDEGDGKELREGGEVFERPLLGDPAGKGAGEDEGAGGKFAFGLAGGEMNGLEVGDLGEVRVLVNDVGGAAGEAFAIEPGGGHFARIGGADDAAGAGEAGDEGGLDEALEVEGEVEVEALLRAEGWTILRPETVSVAEQLAALDTAEMIAGFAGSAFHGLMLGRDVQARIVIFSRHPKVEVNYAMIAAAKGLDQRIVRLEHGPVGDGSARAGIRLARPDDVTAALRDAAASLSRGSAA